MEQNVKNDAEAYMLKELSLMKWQEKATKLAHEDTSKKMVEVEANLTSLEENLKTKRFVLVKKSIKFHFPFECKITRCNFLISVLGRLFKKV